MKRIKGYAHQALAYAVAIGVSVAAGIYSHQTFPDWHLLAHVGIADLVGTIVIFVFSRIHDNSSLYDPYWSVAPIVLVMVYESMVIQSRFALVLGVLLWGIRLTYNFLSGWKGLDHEDWRYIDFREKYPRAYWLVSFAGIHLFPTILVFLGCLPIYVTYFPEGEAIGGLRLLGVFAMAIAVTIEAAADGMLRDFVRSDPAPGTILDEGIWRYSRHPNYFGELMFWWGLWIYGVGSSPETWLWTLAGPVSMTLLFVFVSIPLLDERSLERRPGYEEHMKKVSGLIPLPRRD